MKDIVSWSTEQVPYTHANRLIDTDWFGDSNQFPDSEIKASIFEKMGYFFNRNQPIMEKYFSLDKTRIPNKTFPERTKECTKQWAMS